MLDMSLTALRERIEELEYENAELRRILKPTGARFKVEWALTPAETAILATLLQRESATYEHLAVAAGVDQDAADPEFGVKVHVCRMRPRLRKDGIEIKTIWHVGYALTAEMKKKVRLGLTSGLNVES